MDGIAKCQCSTPAQHPLNIDHFRDAYIITWKDHVYTPWIYFTNWSLVKSISFLWHWICTMFANWLILPTFIAPIFDKLGLVSYEACRIAGDNLVLWSVADGFEYSDVSVCRIRQRMLQIMWATTWSRILTMAQVQCKEQLTMRSRRWRRLTDQCLYKFR